MTMNPRKRMLIMRVMTKRSPKEEDNVRKIIRRGTNGLKNFIARRRMKRPFTEHKAVKYVYAAATLKKLKNSSGV